MGAALSESGVPRPVCFPAADFPGRARIRQSRIPVAERGEIKTRNVIGTGPLQCGGCPEKVMVDAFLEISEKPCHRTVTAVRWLLDSPAIHVRVDCEYCA